MVPGFWQRLQLGHQDSPASLSYTTADARFGTSHDVVTIPHVAPLVPYLPPTTHIAKGKSYQRLPLCFNVDLARCSDAHIEKLHRLGCMSVLWIHAYAVAPNTRSREKTDE
jgi:hypothetical protein